MTIKAYSIEQEQRFHKKKIKPFKPQFTMDGFPSQEILDQEKQHETQEPTQTPTL